MIMMWFLTVAPGLVTHEGMEATVTFGTHAGRNSIVGALECLWVRQHQLNNDIWHKATIEPKCEVAMKFMIISHEFPYPSVQPNSFLQAGHVVLLLNQF
jgi:hypothetical protein